MSEVSPVPVEEVPREDFLIRSPYPKVGFLFDKKTKDGFPDVEFLVRGREESLWLHRALLSNASEALNKLFCCKLDASDSDSLKKDRLEWTFGPKDDKAYCDAVVNWLRFCYGVDLSLQPTQCGAAIAALQPLKLTCEKELKEDLEGMMVDAAQEDLELGMLILSSCVPYKECNEISSAVAKGVFSLERMLEDSDESLLGYMMELQKHNVITEGEMIKSILVAVASLKRKLCDIEALRKQNAALKSRAETAEGLVKKFVVCSSSKTSEIDAGEYTTFDGGAIYDSTRKIILSVSGKYGQGRAIKVTRMTDPTHGSTTITQAKIPFATSGQYPLYDGVLYTYFFQSQEAQNNRFGRLNMNTLAFEELQTLPSSGFREHCNGCFHNGNIYILNANLCVCEYDTSAQAWNTLSLALPSKARLMSDPSDSDCIYCLFEGTKFSRVNLERKTYVDLCSPPVKYSLANNCEAYFHRTSYGFFVFATFSNEWYIYTSIDNSWLRLKNWRSVSSSSAHFLVVPEGSNCFYHVQDNANWEMVELPFFDDA